MSGKRLQNIFWIFGISIHKNFHFPIKIFIFGILTPKNFDFRYFDTQEYLSLGFFIYPKIQRFSVFWSIYFSFPNFYLSDKWYSEFPPFSILDFPKITFSELWIIRNLTFRNYGSEIWLFGIMDHQKFDFSELWIIRNLTFRNYGSSEMCLSEFWTIRKMNDPPQGSGSRIRKRLHAYSVRQLLITRNTHFLHVVDGRTKEPN